LSITLARGRFQVANIAAGNAGNTCQPPPESSSRRICSIEMPKRSIM
jgi:hypothetical protein